MSSKKKFFMLYGLEFLLISAALLCTFREFSLIKGDDGMDQFYPVFVYCGKYIRGVLKGILQGEFCLPQFDFSIGMGEGVIPVLNYYGFGDPFMLLSAVVPVRYSIYAYTAMILIKMYVSGFGFIYYCKKRNVEESGILLGLPFYLANNFLFYFCFQYPPYQSVLISLPFLCAGLDEVIGKKENGKKISIVLILAVAYQALYGFYLLYMELLFAAVYALVQLLCNIGFHKKIFGKIGILFGHIVTGLMTGGIFFIPTVVGYFNSSRGSGGRLSFKVLMQLEEGKYWEAFSSLVTPVNYSAVGMVVPALAIAAVIFALIKKSGHKDLKIVMLLLFFAYVKMRLTAYIAGGFTVDVYLNRWIFCAVFVMAVLSSIGAEWLYRLSKKGWAAYGAAGTVYFLVLLLVEQKWYTGGMKTQRHSAWIVYLTMVILSTVVFVLIGKYKSIWIKGAAGICVTAFTVLNIYTLFGVTEGYGYGAKWNFETYDNARSKFEASNAQMYNTKDDTFARKDIKGNSANESLYMGHYGTREYYSILNGNIYDFYRGFVITTGLNGVTYRLTGLDSRSGMEDLLSVVYYDDVKADVVINNEDYLPVGFTFDQYYLEEEADKISAIAKNANILGAVILNEPAENIEKAELNDTLWTEEDYEIEYTKIEFDDSLIKVKPDSKILLTVDSKTDGECYLYAKHLQLKGNITPNMIYFGERECVFKNTTAQNLIKEHPALVCLGNIEKGKTVFEIGFAQDAEYSRIYD